MSGREFLISKDECFRPVALHSGFDGAFYILDMHKGFIQHIAYMSTYLRNRDIVDLVSYISSTFAINGAGVNEKEVSELRLELESQN